MLLKKSPPRTSTTHTTLKRAILLPKRKQRTNPLPKRPLRRTADVRIIILTMRVPAKRTMPQGRPLMGPLSAKLQPLPPVLLPEPQQVPQPTSPCRRQPPQRPQNHRKAL
ncbi:hypothetical protein AA0473_0650 [Acetobacter orleanensis NRIC 0473]|uniref:Uncharacterized protein n=1 Tax=Acetobacter orleanensis TaxID=104099 RepID=A0A4Y3TKL2_9PROT|nr:hypothetical protein Abol_021_087 [Acetobacter orleanensis JCM 7639]GBR24509.1 hypothetical protein AA0473_0650 [Acetobacter orleanensis NRIC 0473]GEB82294.1 hypothetical protein AOR01nite_07710 [Acetobacter orleanensis]